MLSFGIPLALLFGLLVVPVAVLYFLRMRFRRQPVGSAFIWRSFIDKNEGGRKVRRRSAWLLVLQLLAVVLAALALAAPSYSADRASPPGRLYLIDVSASMGAQAAPGGGRETRLDSAVRLIRQDLQDDPPAGPLMAFTCAQAARPLGQPTRDPAAFLSRIANLDPGDGAVDEAAVSEDLAAWLAGRGEAWEARVYTDGGWSLGGQRLRAIFSDAISAYIVGQPIEDLGVHGLRIQEDGQGGAVASFGLSSSFKDDAPYRAILRMDGAELGSAQGLARPGQGSVRISLSGGAVSGGYEIALIGAEDAYPADDSAYLALNPALSPRVLLSGTGDPYLGAALASLGAEVVRSSPGTAAGGGFDLAILYSVDSEPGSEIACDALFIGSIPPDRAALPGAIVSGSVSGSANGQDGAHLLTRFTRWESAWASSARALELKAEAEPLAFVAGQPVMAGWERGGFKRIALGLSPAEPGIGLSPVFPLLVRNLVEWCAPGSGQRDAYTFTVGWRVARPLRAALKADDASAAEGLYQGDYQYLTMKKKGIFPASLSGGARVVAAANLPLSELDLEPRPLVLPRTAVALAASIGRRSSALAPLAALALLACLALEWLLWRGVGKAGKAQRAKEGR